MAPQSVERLQRRRQMGEGIAGKLRQRHGAPPRLII
jgi:hypothetical protein